MINLFQSRHNREHKPYRKKKKEMFEENKISPKYHASQLISLESKPVFNQKYSLKWPQNKCTNWKHWEIHVSTLQHQT